MFRRSDDKRSSITSPFQNKNAKEDNDVNERSLARPRNSRENHQKNFAQRLFRVPRFGDSGRRSSFTAKTTSLNLGRRHSQLKSRLSDINFESIRRIASYRQDELGDSHQNLDVDTRAEPEDEKADDNQLPEIFRDGNFKMDDDGMIILDKEIKPNPVKLHIRNFAKRASQVLSKQSKEIGTA